MALRDIAGDMARSSAGLWKAVADTVDPKPRAPRHDVIRPQGSAPAPVPGETGPADADAASIDNESGQMLVPIDAWTRILEQVGHVHEAGQQLADARERAARAETENEFLKEQLRDLKGTPRSARRPAASGPSASSAANPVPAADPISRARVRRAREVASRWLNPK